MNSWIAHAMQKFKAGFHRGGDLSLIPLGIFGLCCMACYFKSLFARFAKSGDTNPVVFFRADLIDSCTA